MPSEVHSIFLFCRVPTRSGSLLKKNKKIYYSSSSVFFIVTQGSPAVKSRFSLWTRNFRQKEVLSPAAALVHAGDRHPSHSSRQTVTAQIPGAKRPSDPPKNRPAPSAPGWRAGWALWPEREHRPAGRWRRIPAIKPTVPGARPMNEPVPPWPPVHQTAVRIPASGAHPAPLHQKKGGFFKALQQ